MNHSSIMSRYLLLFLFASLSLVNGQRVGNPDDTARIERPCSVFNHNCIRKYFAEHAHCSPTQGPIPDPYIRPQVNLFIPRTNMSITIIDQVISASNARIEEFYINRDTDKMVIAIEFRNLSQSSNTTYFRFHRRAKEPVVTMAPASVTYQSIVITAVIPYIDNLQLKSAECTAFSNDSAPPTTVGPSALESSDPQVQIAFAEFLAGLPINVQEIFLTDAAFYAALFIQYNICDFGLRVI